jgi:hypothetical protein
VNVPLAALRKIFPPISASPVAPRPPLLSQPRPKRASTDLPAPPPTRRRSNGDEDDDSENIHAKEEEVDVDVDVVDSGDVPMRERAPEEPVARSVASPRRVSGKVSKAEMKELFENVSSPLVKVPLALTLPFHPIPSYRHDYCQTTHTGAGEREGHCK